MSSHFDRKNTIMSSDMNTEWAAIDGLAILSYDSTNGFKGLVAKPLTTEESGFYLTPIRLLVSSLSFDLFKVVDWTSMRRKVYLRWLAAAARTRNSAENLFLRRVELRFYPVFSLNEIFWHPRSYSGVSFCILSTSMEVEWLTLANMPVSSCPSKTWQCPMYLACAFPLQDS